MKRESRKALVGMDASIELEQFESFFARTSSALVAQAYVLVDDWQEAQDLAQEALTRAWNRWPSLSAYDDPAAWTRRVLFNLAVSRLRRRRVEHRHRAAESQVAPAIDNESVDLLRAVRRLPVAQRSALVLREVVGLSIDDVANELNASPGTVRKWLHRARMAVATEMTAGDPVMRPPKRGVPQ